VSGEETINKSVRRWAFRENSRGGGRDVVEGVLETGMLSPAFICGGEGDRGLTLVADCNKRKKKAPVAKKGGEGVKKARPGRAGWRG